MDNSGPTSVNGEGKALSTQQQILVDYMKRGSTVTNAVAITCLGIGSLSKRISELNRLGYPIVTEDRTDRYERRYRAYYFLKGDGAEGAREEGQVDADIIVTD